MEDEKKLIQLFEFLKHYNELRNPMVTDINNQPWHRWMDSLPIHENIDDFTFNDEEECLIAVRKPKLTECPKPPEILKGWLKNGWQDAYEQLEVHKEMQQINPLYGESIEEPCQLQIQFDASSERVKAFKEWKTKRDQWAVEEIDNLRVDEWFNAFYQLYADMKKEGEAKELVWGDGILVDQSTQKIIHPILIQPVQLEFDATVPEFKLVVADKGPELYKGLLNVPQNENTELLLDVYKEFDTQEKTPFNTSETNSFLQRVCLAISAQGKFQSKYSDLAKDVKFPQIYRRPILFLRKRNLGFNAAIERILEELNIGSEIPHFLNEIVGVHTQSNKNENLLKESTPSQFVNPNGLDKEILLTKPANSEQLMVAKYLQTNGAVLVQGPPGTGKTHTIANMIGHLLSEGKSILVTSYSEKALAVVKEKVVEELQALCISLLSSTESRKEMERTLDGINEQRSHLDLSYLKTQIHQLQIARDKMIEQLNQVRCELKKARLSEYTPIVVSGTEYSPIEAATYVKEHQEEADWIPGTIYLGASLPFSEADFEKLYSSNDKISREMEQEHYQYLPKIEEMMLPLEWQKLITSKKTYMKEELNKYQGYWGENITSFTSNDLEKVQLDLHMLAESIDLNMPWILKALEDARDSSSKQIWIGLTQQIEEVKQMAAQTLTQCLNYNPKIQSIDGTLEINEQLEKIIQTLEQGKKITRVTLMMNPKMKVVFDSCQVNDHVPQKLNEFKALKAFYELCEVRKKLKIRWNAQMVPLGAEPAEQMGEALEETCLKYKHKIEESLNWYNLKWNPLLENLQNIGLNVQQVDQYEDYSTDCYSRIKYIIKDYIPRLQSILRNQMYKMEYEALVKKQQALKEVVKHYSVSSKSSILMEFERALVYEDSPLYTKAYDTLLELNHLGESIQKRKSLLRQLETVAPEWANAIRGREGIHGKGQVPGDVKTAWLYKQFVDELAFRNSISMEKIQKEMTQVEDAIRTNTSQLAFNKAWFFKLTQFENNRSQIQAIEGWRQLIRKIGAGKGKNAERFKLEARKLMPQCQSAVPVWIMPLIKVVENFNPKQNKFDVVIIDEASQADLMALVALYLGKQVIIVGDHEQVSPLAIGEKLDDVEALTKQYLYEIPNPYLYTGKFSIYDLAQTTGYQPIRLKEHFRCVPEIIEYSNKLSYNLDIKPLRDASRVLTKPAIIPYRVEHGVARNKVNTKEVETIVALILACCKQKEYNKKTFGVITLRGDRQATEIERRLQSRMTPTEYKERNILCGNSAQFQGDERDIVFLSMVDSNEKEGPLRLFTEGPDNLYKKRYNVAVSRAKDQLWVVYSMDAENDLKVGDIRKGLLDYCKNYKSSMEEYRKKSEKAESEFEKRVMKHLISSGYKIIPQWHVGAYRIDMVAIYKDKKIAIECDGDKYHTDEQLESDMNRQAILERLGWRFIRIRGSQFFQDEVGTMNHVMTKLNEAEIYPEQNEDDSQAVEELLKETIIREAESILRGKYEM